MRRPPTVVATRTPPPSTTPCSSAAIRCANGAGPAIAAWRASSRPACRCLRLIVLIEARAEPRLRSVEGLWRRSTKTKPGKITDFIRAERLLPEAEIAAIRRDAPTNLIRFQDAASLVPVSERPTMEAWIATFNAGLMEAE